MLSGDGRCKTLSQNADGYARGEAVGAFILAPASSDAGALLAGSATNQDGTHTYLYSAAFLSGHHSSSVDSFYCFLFQSLRIDSICPRTSHDQLPTKARNKEMSSLMRSKCGFFSFQVALLPLRRPMGHPSRVFCERH